MEALNNAPQTSSFVSLTEHQSRTPASFHDGPAVLHYYSDRCQVVVVEDELQDAPVLREFVQKASRPMHSNEPIDGNGSEATGKKIIEHVDVWATSDKLLLYSNTAQAGFSIPYPTIALHAIQSQPTPSSEESTSQSVYMQLIPSTGNDGDDGPDTVSLTILPTAAAVPGSSDAQAEADDEIENEDKPQETPAQALFNALSACSNLHPDPMDEDEEEDGSRLMQAGLALPGTSDGSLPPPMPGSGGWITAENMHEFIDADGNWIERDDNEDGESLGPGAGSVRPRDDDGSNGHTNGNGDDTKWQRTS